MKHVLLLVALSIATASQSQDRSRHAGYDVLDAFVGTWTIPGQESTYRETCAWYHGERHIVCHTESKRQDDSIGYSMSILSFVPDQGYVYTGIGSRGRYEAYEKGTFRDGILEYTYHSGGETTRIRVGPFKDRDVIPFIVHTSRNGADWETAESFHYTRVK